MDSPFGEGGHSYPLMLDFETGNVCNLECIMCNGEYSSTIRKNREGKPVYPDPYDDAFVEQLKSFLPHLKQARFTGGEPFLNEIYYKIWELIRLINPGIEISIQTNGTIWNQKVKTLLEQNNVLIGISIDSLNPERYEKIRKNAAYEQLMQNLARFHEYARKRGKTLRIDVCPMRINWMDIPEMIKYCNEQEILINFHTVHFPPQLALWNLPAGELQRIYNTYQNTALPASSPIQQMNRDRFDGLLNQIKQWYEKRKHQGADHRKAESLDTLKQKFIQRLHKAVAEDQALDEMQKQQLHHRIDEILANLLYELSDDVLSVALPRLMQYPPRELAGETVMADKDRWEERIKHAAMELS